jgi:hypothetical protein
MEMIELGKQSAAEGRVVPVLASEKS